MRKNATSDHAFWTSSAGKERLAGAAMKKRALEVRCMECGAGVGEPCKFSNGAPRKYVHQLRKI